MQRALFELGRVPEFHQTDNSTAATHRIPDGSAECFDDGKRPFNAEYLALMKHLGMKPRTTAVGAKEQNGDVEATNGAFKRRLEQALLLRGSRDFETYDAWQAFIDRASRKANGNRSVRIAEDLVAMRELTVARLPEYTEERAKVSERSTVRIKYCAYSVPSRLKGTWVRVRIFEDKIEIRHANVVELACERLRGRGLNRIDYRHVIWSLVRKPGGFARYVFREEMFPTVIFREAYDAIQAAHPGTRGDLVYLRILHLAASTIEADVAVALTLLQMAKMAITVDAVKEMVASSTSGIEIPSLVSPPVDLVAYDALLDEVAA